MTGGEDRAEACPEWDNFPAKRSRYSPAGAAVPEAEVVVRALRFAERRVVLAAAFPRRALRARRAALHSVLVAIPPRRRQGPA